MYRNISKCFKCMNISKSYQRSIRQNLSAEHKGQLMEGIAFDQTFSNFLKGLVHLCGIFDPFDVSIYESHQPHSAWLKKRDLRNCSQNHFLYRFYLLVVTLGSPNDRRDTCLQLLHITASVQSKERGGSSCQFKMAGMA